MIYEANPDNFFIQKINLINIEESRFDFFQKLCSDKKVIHIGCADAQVFNTDNNLHLYLKKTSRELHGLDIDQETLKTLDNICPGIYFTNYQSCDKNYDFVIAPEVLEHVFNAKIFLDEIFSIKAKEYLISVPNVIHYAKEMIQENDFSVEIIHPDHKCWFSPYTLYKIVKPYIKNELDCKMYYLEHQSMIAIHIRNNNDNLVE